VSNTLRTRTSTHGNTPFRLHHLIPSPPQYRSQFIGNPTRTNQNVCLLGLKDIRSIPNLAKSKLEAAEAIISMAQHAVPKGMGHREFLRAQFTTKSTLVVRKVGAELPAIGSCRLLSSIIPTLSPLFSIRIPTLRLRVRRTE